MKIALIGDGAMGKLIRSLAEAKGHEIVVIIDEKDSGLSSSEVAAKLRGAEMAIDFTVAEAVRRNVGACMLAGVPLVEGTTGWSGQRDEIERVVRDAGGSFVFGANFSLGVNLFYRVVRFASELFSKFPEYEAFIEEQHHSRKKES